MLWEYGAFFLIQYVASGNEWRPFLTEWIWLSDTSDVRVGSSLAPETVAPVGPLQTVV